MAKAFHASRPAARKEMRSTEGRQWLTDSGVLLAGAIVGARMLMAEPLKQTLANPLPGTAGAPLGPGPATGLVLDLLAWLPAIAVLLRLVLDSRYTLRRTGAFVVMGLLGLWAVASMAWSGDKFAAIVSAFHQLSALVLLWALAQSVRSWVHFRLVAGLCAGLLAALAVKGYTDRFYEQPLVRANWNTEKQQVMQENHWTEDSVELKLFQGRVLSEQAMGFSQSPNTYAGLVVMLGTVTAGLILDRRGKSWRWLGVVAVIGVCLPLIKWTQCRAAYATPVMSAGFLGLVVWKRRWLAGNRHRIFLGAAGAIAVGFAAIIGLGIIRGNLIHSSLTFRWWYWIGSARIIRAHPLLGVGWGNFGVHYLGVRLPIASEEILDPHNFIVRFFTDLGAIGGVLLLTGLTWLAWKLTAGVADEWEQRATESTPPRGGWLWALLAIPIGAIILNFFASVDFSQSSDFIVDEAANRFFWLAAMVAGMALALVRRAPAARGQIVLEREISPASVTTLAILVAMGVFLIHNLIEFGLFEPGPMTLLALLTGAMLGMRLDDREIGIVGRYRARAMLAGGIVAWLAAAILLVAPIMVADGQAESADDLLRAGRAAEAQAAAESAAAKVPYNAQYPIQAAGAAIRRQPRDVAAAMRLLHRALAVDPMSLTALLMRANIELLPPATPASMQAAIADDRQALVIDPNNVGLRLQLGYILERVDQKDAAKEQFARALELNDALEQGDPKRLSSQEIESVRRALAALPGP